MTKVTATTTTEMGVTKRTSGKCPWNSIQKGFE